MESRRRIRELKQQVAELSKGDLQNVISPTFATSIAKDSEASKVPLHLLKYMFRIRRRQRELLRREKRDSHRDRSDFFNVVVQKLQSRQEERFFKRRRLDDHDATLFADDALEYVAQKSTLEYPSEEQVEKRRMELWHVIATKIIPRVHQLRIASRHGHILDAKKIAQQCEKELKKSAVAKSKSVRELAARAKKANREMILFWKRNEKEEREQRKRAEREAMDRLKAEQEEREQRRQARKLHFLISQTELYSHFVGNKLGDVPQPAAEVATKDFEAIDFAEIDDGDLEAMARKSAAEALAKQREKTQSFDQSAKERRIAADDKEKLDFLNPTSMPGAVEVSQPKMLTCQLKPYQMKGLNWLANLYEQGINGILADDM